MPLELAEIQADLRSRCQEIPLRVWEKIGLEVKAGAIESSDLIPDESCGFVNGRRILVSGSELELVLVRSGRIIEKIVGYWDDPEGPTVEILGETSPEEYLRWHGVLMFKLDHLKETLM